MSGPTMSFQRKPEQPGYPGHHPKCKVLHSVRSYPCYPQGNDAFTIHQKEWIQENKENIPPPFLQRSNAILHATRNQTPPPEKIEEDDSESDIEEEERHDGPKHGVPSSNKPDPRSGNSGGKRSDDHPMVTHRSRTKGDIRKR